MNAKWEFGSFSPLYGQFVAEFAQEVGESGQPYGEAKKNIREEIVRCVWFGAHFPPMGLATDDGRHLEVLSPGWWNVEGGPDFIRAEFLLEGAGRVVGDVEVHTASSSWYSHGHHRQPEYDEVALHVVMWNDRDDETVRSRSGRSIPQLALGRFVEKDLEELVEAFDMEEAEKEAASGPSGHRYCARALADGELTSEWVGKFLDLAGDHRVVSKAEAAAQLLQERPREDILYESLAEALGYKNNRMPMMQLATMLPLSVLRKLVPCDGALEERSSVLEAALLGVGGFLEVPPDKKTDAETTQYLDGLCSIWQGFPGRIRSSTMSAGHWQFAGTRPVNYPPRRIAALSRLYAGRLHGGLFSHLVQSLLASSAGGRRKPGAALVSGLSRVFLEVDHPYWSYRYAFGGKKLARPRSLIGKERATGIVVDVLLPLFLAHARQEHLENLSERLHLLWSSLPRRQPNTVTRRMNQVMFPDTAAAAEVVNSARRQQGLHQLYKDFCGSEGGCERCVLYLSSLAGKDLGG